MNHRVLSHFTLGILVGLITGVWITATYFGLFRDIIEPLSAVTTFVSAGASILLVVVTAAYVVLTREMVAETEEARKQEVMPILDLEWESISLGTWSPKLKNVGNGPAMDVEATIEVVPNGEEHTIASKNIAPRDFAGTISPQITADASKRYDEVLVTGTYTNVFGETKPFEINFDLEILSNTNSADALMKRDKDKKNLEKIASSIKSISDVFERDEVEVMIEQWVNEPIVDALHKKGTLSLADLSRETGISPFHLAARLTFLQSDGIVECNVDTDEIMDTPAEDTVISLASK